MAYQRVRTKETHSSDDDSDSEPTAAEMAKHQQMMGMKKRAKRRRWLREKVEAALWVTACGAIMWCVVNLLCVVACRQRSVTRQPRVPNAPTYQRVAHRPVSWECNHTVPAHPHCRVYARQALRRPAASP
jgi:hypothetical protein